MDVEPVDLGDEIRQRVEPRFDLAPVMLCRPMARELLHRGELDALRCVRNLLPLRPYRRADAPAQVGKLVFRCAEGEWNDSGPLVGVLRSDGRPTGQQIGCTRGTRG